MLKESTELGFVDSLMEKHGHEDGDVGCFVSECFIVRVCGCGFCFEQQGSRHWSWEETLDAMLNPPRCDVW
jgi:hypothetical protein